MARLFDTGARGHYDFLHERAAPRPMQVVAISTPRSPAWRWRISDYTGTTVEESAVTFASIAAAVAAGRERLMTMAKPDRSDSVTRAWHMRFGRRDHEGRGREP